MKLLSIDLVFKHIKGGPADLRELMLKAGQPAPPLTNVSKWKQRGWVPSKWVGAVIWTCACAAIDPLLLLEEVEE